MSCFGLVWGLFQFTIEWFRTIRPISGWDGWDGMDGRLSPFDGLLRAPTVLIKVLHEERQEGLPEHEDVG